ncbi:DUF4382 domain-containing protein [Tamlana sp. 2201CG12-4]|uniref:DUF4382 domain-containing protein n=1 Tax=Tamlana sp. 2201CG12-4 TaxID=3112582 RepID=UPI002DB7C401|nr:DUF4382 domain-containing protein [Tamlana sp. 2201CG12-4]MEC3906049.1 DUF4382 domain-containing protein [Tamlana sp. 2201CG12-4]
MNTLKKFIFPLLFLTFILSCNDNDTEAESIKKGEPTISIRLVDAPGDYEAVNVEIVDVMIKMDDDSDDNSGWISLEANNEIVNLLDFTGGFSKILVDRFPIPAGTLSQMRLVLGDGNTIVIKDSNDEDETFDLKTPSGQQSGLKLKVREVIEEGFTYDFILDFDVDKSIVHAGNSGNIILKPVLYLALETNSGIIEGIVTPTDVPSKVTVLVDDMGTPEAEDDFVISALTDENGAFALWGVPAGTYDVKAMPLDETSDYNYGETIDVVVVKGEITVIPEPIELMLKTGSISGKISGLAEGVLATVSINEETSVETNAEGIYLIEDVVPDDYTVTITAEGYVTQNIDVTIEPDENEIVDATLVAVP